MDSKKKVTRQVTKENAKGKIKSGGQRGHIGQMGQISQMNNKE